MAVLRFSDISPKHHDVTNKSLDSLRPSDNVLDLKEHGGESKAKSGNARENRPRSDGFYEFMPAYVPPVVDGLIDSGREADRHKKVFQKSAWNPRQLVIAGLIVAGLVILVFVLVQLVFLIRNITPINPSGTDGVLLRP